MARFVAKYVQSCLDCAYSKGNYGRGEGFLHPIEKVAEPFHTVHIDHLGPFTRSVRGNSYLLVIIDSFTKFTLAEPTKTLKTGETIQRLTSVFGVFGYPRRLISDRGLAFTSKAFSEFLARRGVRHVLNAIATPRANGQVERQNRTIIDALATSIDAETRWDEKVPDIIWGMNHTVNGSTQFSPAELLFSHSGGVIPSLNSNTDGDTLGESVSGGHVVSGTKAGGMNHDDIGENPGPSGMSTSIPRKRRLAAANLTRASEVMAKRYNKRRKVATVYRRGDLVLWRQAGTGYGEKGVNRKLSNKYDGPYKVTKVLANDRYEISAVKGMRGYKKFKAVVASDSLRRYCGSGDLGSDLESGDSE